MAFPATVEPTCGTAAREFFRSKYKLLRCGRGCGSASRRIKPDLWYSGVMLVSSPKRSNETHERLLELAEAAVMAKGFAATSIDELIAAAGISKSGFFYHFKDKSALAKELLL